jgi:prephenate dehydrogenase
MDMNEFDLNITIVGLGLIGGSYAMAIKELNPRNIWGVDIDNDALQYAEAYGIIDQGYSDPTEPLANSDLVIICLYPSETIEFMKKNLANFKPGTLITDATGIKERVLKEITEILPTNLQYVGGHPMAGREYSGIRYAMGDLFLGANYILTPTPQNDEASLQLIEQLATRIGCKSVMRVTPQAHDQYIAFTSQLPHLLASALVDGNINEQTKYFVGGSFADGTRVAKINLELWPELLLENGANLLEPIERFEENLRAMKEAILSKEKEDLINIFARGNEKKALVGEKK